MLQRQGRRVGKKRGTPTASASCPTKRSQLNSKAHRWEIPDRPSQILRFSFIGFANAEYFATVCPSRHNRLAFPVLAVIGEQGNRARQTESRGSPSESRSAGSAHQSSRLPASSRKRSSTTGVPSCSGHLRAGMRGWQTVPQAALSLYQRGSGGSGLRAHFAAGGKNPLILRSY